MIIYQDFAGDLSPDKLRGFFVGWPHPPKSETLLKLLKQSYAALVALDDQTGQVVGFITAHSDGILSAYIPLLEVLPAYRGQGLGNELVRRMLLKLDNLYMIDLVCDEGLCPFYEKMGLQRGTAMMLRNYQRQSGNLAL